MSILLSVVALLVLATGVVVIQLNRDLKDLAEYELMLLEATE